MEEKERFLILVARKLSGEASDTDLSELEDLLTRYPGFQTEFDYLRDYWNDKNNVISDLDVAFKKVMQRARTEENVIRTETDEPAVKPIAAQAPVRKKWLQTVAIAASLAVFVLSGYFIYRAWLLQQPSTVVAGSGYKIHENPKGSTSVIYLSDSTRVILNADTKLQFPKTFDGPVREVFLTGEAFFDVRHDEKKPFIIHAGRMNIRVLGTEFNIRSYPGDSTSEASLIRGMIEVTLTDRPSDKIILKPSEKLVISNDIESGKTPAYATSVPSGDAKLSIGNLYYISPSDSTVMETSWVDNRLIFKDESFYKLARDLERRYDVDISFEDSHVRNYRFTGAFEKESIAEVLNALKLTEKFNYRIKQDSIIIY